MYKIILVDDEKLVLKSLMATIDWDNYGFEVVDCATSAGEALEKIKEYKPDVVFTDIRMPEISGLELLQMMKALCPDLICLVISGYAEFAYAQKALKLEAAGYCLKPFDYDEITTYLKKFKDKLDEKGKKKQKDREILELLEDRSEAARQKLSIFFLEHEVDFSIDTIRAVHVMGKTDVLDDIARKYLFSARCGYDKFTFIAKADQIPELLGRFRELETETGYPIYAGVSKRIDSVDLVGKAIQEARKLSYQHFCQPDCHICETLPKDREIYQILQFRADKGNRNEQDVKEKIQGLSKAFTEGKMSIDAGIFLRNLLETWLDEKEDLEVSWDYDALCEEYENADELLSCLEDRLLENEGDKESLKKIANQTFLGIYQYVEENFRERLTAGEIAQKFHVNVCYVSHLFKKETGKTFTEFLTEKRITNACKMLRETNVNISEIAELSGFNDYFYFSRVFRKVMNCTPSEYRTRI